MPNAFGYARVSHINSFKKGDSIHSQEERITNYYEMHLKPLGINWCGVHDDETNVSAFKTPFYARPAGKKIIGMMRPGDHLVIDKIDRIFRSVKDFVKVMEFLERNCIRIHIVNFLGSTVQNDTPMGQFILKLFVMVAELESEIKSERIRDAVNAKRGVDRRHVAPPGCEQCFVEVSGRLVPVLRWCETERSLMDYVVTMIDDKKHTWAKAFPKIIKRIDDMGYKQYQSMSNDKKDRMLRNLYKYEVAYRRLGIEDPSEIPSTEIISAAAKEHLRLRTEKRAAERPNKYPKLEGGKRSKVDKVDLSEAFSFTV